MVQRVFFPGSCWLYFKIYTSCKNADKLLSNNIVSFTNRLIEYDYIEKWFFIRYADPNPHIRLRLKLKSQELFSEVLLLFSKEFEKELIARNIWDYKIDTYKRELERYGAYRIDEIETIFCLDSLCILNLLKGIENIEDKECIRWQLGLSLIDGLLDSFTYSSEERNCLMRSISDSFSKEFGFTSSGYTKQLNNKYRINSPLIEQTINRSNKNIESFIPIIDQRTYMISKIVSEKNIEHSINDLISSLIHMSMNRLFISNNKANEVVLYYLLSKFYSSHVAKMKYLKC